MEYDDRDRAEPFIIADIRYADGSTGKIYFHTGSEEAIYQLLESETAEGGENESLSDIERKMQKM